MDEYWSVKQRDNFAKYCHPMRNDMRTEFSEVVAVINNMLYRVFSLTQR